MGKAYTKLLLKHSTIYGSSEILAKFVGFILLPVYARFLAPDEYGRLQLLIVTSNLLSVFLQLGLGSAIFKSILHGDNPNRNEVYSTALYFMIAISVLVTLPLVNHGPTLSELLVGTPDLEQGVRIIFLSVLLKNFSVIPLAKLRIEDRSVHYGIISLSRFLLQIGLNILYVVVLEQGIIGIIYAEFWASFAFVCVYLFVLRKEITLRFSTPELRKMLAFGLPLVPAAIAMFAITMSNRYFLKHFSTLEEVAFFSVGYRFGSIMAIAVGAFQRAWGATMFHIAKEADAQTIYQRNFTLLMLCLSMLALLLSVFSKEILLIMTPGDYVESYKIVPFMALSYLFDGIYYYTSVGLNLKRKTYWQPLAVGLAACVNLVLNFALISKYGMIGAAISNTVAFAVMAIIAASISHRYYPIHYEYARLLKLGGVVLAAFAIAFNLEAGSTLLTLAIKSVIVLGCPFVLYWSGFFHADETAKMRRLVGLSIQSKGSTP